MSQLFTIGFTKKSAEQFFMLLQDNGITLVADVRLNNSSQLAGFTKARDLKYFLSFVGIKYEHWKNFAPTKELRKSYHTDWDFDAYAESYTDLINRRRALQQLKADVFTQEKVCLLCSEATPEKCHRRVAADLICKCTPGLLVMHL